MCSSSICQKAGTLMTSHWITINRRLLTESAQPFSMGRKSYVAQSALHCVNRFLEEWWRTVQMAGKSTKNGRTAFPETKFIQFKLTADQKKQFSKWVADLGVKDQEEVSLFMAEGVKTSISFDEDKGHWIVSSTCVDEDSENHRCCLTSRAEEWYSGLMMNVFKARVLMAKVPWEEYAADDQLG